VEEYAMLRSACAFVVGAVIAAAHSALADRSLSVAPTLTIARERVCEGKISRFQYGQFIEYLCGLTPSIFAEKVFDGDFEGVPAWQFPALPLLSEPANGILAERISNCQSIEPGSV
jgi:hypothetical protein